MGFDKPTRGTVYSASKGRACPACGHPADACRCAQEPADAQSGPVRVGRETKGRKGRGVTVVTGLGLTHDRLRQLAKELKQACGSGGTVKQGVIEIQGDHRDRVVDELLSRGYEAKRSGS